MPGSRIELNFLWVGKYKIQLFKNIMGLSGSNLLEEEGVEFGEESVFEVNAAPVRCSLSRGAFFKKYF